MFVSLQWQPPHTRMFKLELTDGMTKIHAMEYNTIPDLNLELKPGFKVGFSFPICVEKFMCL